MDFRHLYKDKNKMIKWLGGYTQEEYDNAVYKIRRYKYVVDEYRMVRVPLVQEIHFTERQAEISDYKECAKYYLAEKMGKEMLDQGMITIEEERIGRAQLAAEMQNEDEGWEPKVICMRARVDVVLPELARRGR